MSPSCGSPPNLCRSSAATRSWSACLKSSKSPALWPARSSATSPSRTAALSLWQGKRAFLRSRAARAPGGVGASPGSSWVESYFSSGCPAPCSTASTGGQLRRSDTSSPRYPWRAWGCWSRASFAGDGAREPVGTARSVRTDGDCRSEIEAPLQRDFHWEEEIPMTALPQSTRWFFSNQVVRLTNYDVVSMRVGVSQGLVAMPVRMRNLGQLLRRVLVLVVLVVFVDMRMV